MSARFIDVQKGSITMTTYRLVVLSSAMSGREREFENWYDDVHIPDIAAIEGVVSSSRMRVIDSSSNALDAPAWRSLAIYEFGENAPADVIRRIGEAKSAGTMMISTALDRSSIVKLIVADAQPVPAG